jgi:hypothetical protein
LKKKLSATDILQVVSSEANSTTAKAEVEVDASAPGGALRSVEEREGASSLLGKKPYFGAYRRRSTR